MIKLKLFIWLFKRELAICENEIIQNEQKCERKINKMKAELELHKKQYGLVDRIFFLFPDAKIIAVDTNKRNEEVLVVEKSNGTLFTILLFGPSYQGITNLPRIMATVRKNEVFSYNYVHIDDLINIDDNIGNGSILMKNFLKIVEKLHVDYIDGGLSSVDKGHFDRSEYFYEKFGFKVQFNAERTSGVIKKSMN